MLACLSYTTCPVCGEHYKRLPAEKLRLIYQADQTRTGSAAALGKSATDTAEVLFISLNTVETRRKNIKQKLDTTAYFDLCQYARAFDLV